MSYSFSGNNHHLDGVFSTARGVPLTIVAWIKVSAAQWATTSARYLAFIGDGVDFSPSVRLQRNNNAANRTSAASQNAGGSAGIANLSHSSGAYDDTWVPLIGTFNSDTLRRCYIEDSSNVSSNTSDRDVTSLLDTLRIGAADSGFSNFNGLIAEVAVFDKVLTTGEIDQLQTAAEEGVPPNTVASSNCIGYWPLSADQSSHPDQSGNGGPSLSVTGASHSTDHPTISGGAPKSVTIQLADVDGNNRVNLTNITWAWYDAVPATAAPTDSGLIASDADGSITVEIPNSTLNSGQTGYLAVRVPSSQWNNIYPLQVT